MGFAMRKVLFVALCLVCGVVSAADVYVTEYTANNYPNYQAAVTPPVASSKVTISGSSAQSNAFNAATRVIRVHAEAICSIEIGGASPTATTTSARFIAGQTEYFQVLPGQKLAVITNN